MKFGCKEIVGAWTAAWVAGVAASHRSERTEESAALSTRAYLQGQHPLQLVSVTEAVGDTPGSFKLHRDNLEKVMRRVEPGIPVAIISVVGAFRSGKSFLLSLFLRSLDGQRIDDPSDKSFLGGWDGDSTGFSWKGGHKPHTQGMTVWSQPFFIKTNDGGQEENMAVLLVDTQGTHDHETSTRLHGSLFGLSTTLSSCQIFNVKNQVQTDHLEGLALFLEYAQRAKELEGEQDDEDRPFQRLEFLIRDWGNWETVDEPMTASPETLRNQSLEYLDGILRTKNMTDNKKITGSFRDGIGSFALPFPGSPVATTTFDGEMSSIDRGFRRLLEYYIKTIILDKLVETRLPNMNEAQFVDSVEKWVCLYNEFIDSDRVPDAGSYVHLFNTIENEHSRAAWVNGFKRGTEDTLNKHMDPAELEEKLMRMIGDYVRRFAPRGDQETRNNEKAQLQGQLELEAERIKAKNNEGILAKVMRELGAVVDGIEPMRRAVSETLSDFTQYVEVVWDDIVVPSAANAVDVVQGSTAAGFAYLPKPLMELSTSSTKKSFVYSRELQLFRDLRFLFGFKAFFVTLSLICSSS